ncbi:MAG: ATP-binding cassette domain-containing protein [Deltaproteobacteria bacterium]|nr:ATP-binding cassette domain-containing protein [Deltaproteobacteria bacterium]
MIRLIRVFKSFDNGRSYAVKDLSLEVASGETLVLLGSSGCGKTTTLKMINRLIEPSAGTIEVAGEDVMKQDPVALRRKIGYVFQGIGLFPHMTIAQNVAVVPRLLGWPVQKRRDRAYSLLELVGLPSERFADRFPDELSGGQQQRVGVARALAADPSYLLMDEPFGALDALNRELLQQELLKLKQELQKTIVFVTHDIFEALLLGDRILILHEGRMEQIGTKEEILSRPATTFVRDLFAKPARQLAAFRGLRDAKH